MRIGVKDDLDSDVGKTATGKQPWGSSEKVFFRIVDAHPSRMKVSKPRPGEGKPLLANHMTIAIHAQSNATPSSYSISIVPIQTHRTLVISCLDISADSLELVESTNQSLGYCLDGFEANDRVSQLLKRLAMSNALPDTGQLLAIMNSHDAPVILILAQTWLTIESDSLPHTPTLPTYPTFRPSLTFPTSATFPTFPTSPTFLTLPTLPTFPTVSTLPTIPTLPDLARRIPTFPTGASRGLAIGGSRGFAGVGCRNDCFRRLGAEALEGSRRFSSHRTHFGY